MLSLIDQQNFDPKKLEIFKSQFPKFTKGVTCAQVAVILGKFKYGADHKVVLEAAWPLVLDKQNAELMLSKLKFTTDQDNFRKAWGIANPGM